MNCFFYRCLLKLLNKVVGVEFDEYLWLKYKCCEVSDDLQRSIQLGQLRRTFTNRITTAFGIVLDVDGVLLRGRELLPRVKEALNLITDDNHRFVIPTVFLTNGTNCMRAEKAEKLSHYLGFQIAPSQIIMAHSPLRMFRELHDQHVLVVGQQNARSIATAVGFKNVTTIEDLRSLFPDLDCLDFSRKPYDGTTLADLRQHFQPIDVIVMLGEPNGWESALQLLIDVLLTSGRMVNFTRGQPNYPAQIPVIACNADLVWMAERSELPRIGHGIFIHCLETLYEKLTGRRMHYEAVLGKPTEISYLHAAHVTQRHAHGMEMEAIKTLYVIGDNPMSDVLGAKLFNRYLRHGGRGRFDHLDLDLLEESDPPGIRTRHVVDSCVSILVETGVYREGCHVNGLVQPLSMLIENLSPGEQSALKQPDFVENDLYAAVQLIISRERFRVPI